MLRFFPQKDKYIKEAAEHEFDPSLPIPQHIAIIMDGNGRWAQNRRLPRVAGHKEGKENHETRFTLRCEGIDALCIFDRELETAERGSRLFDATTSRLFRHLCS
jgi:undecaprenyl diphosphate synthase